ncbi:MAG: sigma-70 family RNA polymerase sigma factor [Geminicoccaceae bacterium]
MGDHVDDGTFFRAEIERLTDRLYGVALRLTGHPAAAEDLVAEAVLKAWSNLGQLKDRRCFPKWVLRILTNTFVSGYRKACQEPTIAVEEEGEEQFSLFEQLHQPFLLWWSNPERELLSKLLRRDVERALDNLPDGLRAVVVMVEIEGYSYAEVAAMLGIPIGTVRSRLNRARSMLQRALWRQAREAGLTTAA